MSSKKIRLTILLIPVLIVCANLIMHNIHLNPHRHHYHTERVFISLNLMLAPTTINSALSSDGRWIPPAWPTFGVHRPLRFRLTQNNIEFTQAVEPYLLGTFNVRFGNAVLRDYTARFEFEKLTTLQRTFLLPPLYNCGVSVSDDGIYIVWFKFDEPVAGVVAVKDYVYRLGISSSYSTGVSWIAVKTSNDPDDVCLGIGGNINGQLTRLYDGAGYSFNNFDLQESENAFVRSLFFLSDNQAMTDMFVRTGLWTGAETIDFRERLRFIENNGIMYMGFVAHLYGRDFKCLAEHGVSIVRIDPIHDV